MKRAIVIGASSGMGRQLAILLAAQDYKVGITGRREELLNGLRSTNPDSFVISAFDVTGVSDVPERLNQLVDELGGLDLVILSAGTGKINLSLDGAIEQEPVAVNVAGFTTVACWTFNYFQKQGWGHLVAITSLAGLRGSRQATAYFASKAYQINYLEGLRQKVVQLKLPIYITDARPGFVDTEMAAGDNLFWMATVEKASKQIYEAITTKKSVVYVTKRWRLIAMVLKLMPEFLHKRL